MAGYIDRQAAINSLLGWAAELTETYGENDEYVKCLKSAAYNIEQIPAADVRPVVTCADCKYNNACLTQAFVEEASRVPFDRNTFFCSDGKRCDDA